ncbi:MAG: A/G-specific adenine glycosylase [Candidatus Izemoplasmatales bacterium]
MNEVSERILSFYQEHKRDLPWRNIENPYYTLVSEIMLQQTRVDTVIPYFLRFIEKLPTIESLSMVSEEELLKLWQGLGYYRRAINLQKAAKMVMEKHQGVIPDDYALLIKLPGIGEYTSKAILSIAFNQKAVAVDGNVLRVFTRYYGIYNDVSLDKTKTVIEEKVLNIFPSHSQSDFMQALMEIGALICVPNADPQCLICPLQKECYAYKHRQIEQLPVKTKKDTQKIELRTVLIIHFEDEYHIQKRSEKGLLSSLWELPNRLGHLSLAETTDFLFELGYTDCLLEVGPNKKHVFTHITWNMISYDVKLSSRYQGLISLETIKKDYSIPKAFSIFLPE